MLNWCDISNPVMIISFVYCLLNAGVDIDNLIRGIHCSWYSDYLPIELYITSIIVSSSYCLCMCVLICWYLTLCSHSHTSAYQDKTAINPLHQYISALQLDPYPPNCYPCYIHKVEVPQRREN